jgi:pimeloyl-ACP methyl ester carboxylesterase
MKHGMRALVAALIVGACLAGVPAAAEAQAVPGPCVPGALPSGARSLVCVPLSGWNGQLVVYAHGYVAPGLPLDFYQLTLPDGTPLPALLQSLGYAFATTTYRQNGLAILEGAADIRELVAAIGQVYPPPTRTYLAGVSEGGLVAALLAERSPELFTGALATCAPIGSFRLQTNYIGDFRVLFDYYFPGVIPGSPISIPLSVMQNWQTAYVPAITARLAADPARTAELLRVALAPSDPAQPPTMINTALNLLFYNVFGTNDAAAKLGGNPFDNRLRWYFGSSNDVRLNRQVRRFAAARAAVASMKRYETSGNLTIPLVTLHTTLDETVPAWHELLYIGKVDTFDRGRFVPLPVKRYGHCAFTTTEVLTAFGVLAALP